MSFRRVRVLLRPGSAALLVVMLALPAAAQLQWGGLPPSLGGEPDVVALLKSPPPTAVMEPVDVGAYLLEDSLAPKDVPFRFGATLDVDLGPDGAGVWTELPDGDRVWRLRIASDGAYSLGLLFDEYRLAAGSRLFVHDDSLAHVLGAYDERNNKADGEFAIEPVPGAAITLEYVVPRGASGLGALHVSGVVHDYRDLYALIDKSGSSPGDAAGACNNDVNCPEGVAWQEEKRAVTLLIIGGGLCTGALVNNTASDGAQYYIAANHCGGLSNAIFRFGYEKSGCGSGTAPTNKTVQGSTQLASSSSLDFRLVQITSLIPPSYEPYFLGWDRSGVAPANSITIHHPQGDVKKISFDDNPPTKSGTQWKIGKWDDGVTEPGSSGCPLMDGSGHFIGQLFGGSATCSFPFDDFYGRFDSEWNSVKTWLDPLNTGAVSIEGFDPAGGGPQPPVIASVSPASVTAFLPAQVTLSGDHLSGTTSVNVGNTVLTPPSGFQVVSDDTITFLPPPQATLGAKFVNVTTAAGISNDGTLAYAETLPPGINVPAFIVSGQTLTWNFGGGANDTAWLLIALDPTTFPFQGSNILLGLVVLDVQTLSATGLGSFGALVPPGFSFLTVWSQVADLQDGSGSFLGASPVVSTLIPF